MKKDWGYEYMETSLNKNQNKKSQAFIFIFLGWLVYTVSYFGKVNYSANITQIIDFYGITKAQAGAVPTFFFFASISLNSYLSTYFNNKIIITFIF